MTNYRAILQYHYAGNTTTQIANPESQSSAPQMMFYQSKCTGCGKCKEKCPHQLAFCELCGKCALYCPQDARKICGKEYTVEEVLSEILKDKEYYGESGGVTFSGGGMYAPN